MSNWVLLVIVIVMLLVAAEIGLRINAKVRLARTYARLGVAADDTTWIGSDKPGLYFTFRPSHGDINSRGYPDVEHDLAKPEGTYRIVVIGDSVAAGHEVGWRRSFTRQLEARLTSELPKRRWEVVTLARGGYCTAQELIILKDEAFTYSPDLIIWSYVLNDPADPLFGGACGELWQAYRPPSQLVFLAQRAWFNVRETILARHGPREWHARLHHIYHDQVVSNLSRVGALCREHHVPGVLVIHPVLAGRASFDDYPWAPIHADVRRIATSAGLVVLDGLEAYRGHDPRALGYGKDPWHPNLEGHRLLAEFLASRLRQRNLIPSNPP